MSCLSKTRRRMLPNAHEHATKRAIDLAVTLLGLSGGAAALFPGLEWPEARRLLMIGVDYPDLPCGSRFYDEKADEVRMLNYRKCGQLELVRLLHGNRGRRGEEYSEAYVSHRYTLSALHAMSHHPQERVRDVRARILDQGRVLAAWAARSAPLLQDKDKHKEDAKSKQKQPNVFWLGQLLHLVQDAYSASHVARACYLPGGRSKDRIQKVVAALRLLSEARLVLSKNVDLSMYTAVHLIRRAAHRAAASTDKSAVRTPISSIRGEAKAAGVDIDIDRPEHAKNLFLAFYATAKTAERTREAVRDTRAPPLVHRLLRSAPGNEVDKVVDKVVDTRILTFHCYNSQSPFTHALFDTKSHVTKTGMLSHAIYDTAAMLVLFHHFLTSPQRRQDAQSFTKGVCTFLEKRTFSTVPGVDDVLTGFDLQDVHRELVS